MAVAAEAVSAFARYPRESGACTGLKFGIAFCGTGIICFGMANALSNNGKTPVKSAPSIHGFTDGGAHHYFAGSQPRLGWFERFARATALLAGRPVTFFAALSVVILWLVTGPLFDFSDTWQLVINTGTTIVTFLMVFLIQQSQNRDTMAVQIKLAELIISVKAAHNTLATAEDLSEAELTALHKEYCKKAEHTLMHLESKRGKKAVHEALDEAAETGTDAQP